MVTILAVKIKEKENLSMMRIITPKGELRKVKRVVAVCEMRNQFNGRMDRKIEIANDMSYNPTGVCLELDVRDTGFVACGQEVFIGNLKTEKVQEILRKLLKEGYFDFSELEYQKADLYKETVFDEGKSNAYTSDHVIECCPALLSPDPLGFNTIPPISSVTNGDVVKEFEAGSDKGVSADKEDFDDEE